MKIFRSMNPLDTESGHSGGRFFRKDAPFYFKATIVLVGLFLFFYLLLILRDVFIPLCFAALIAILLNPLVNRLMKWKIPKVLAIIIALLSAILLIGGVIAFISSQVVHFSELAPQLKEKSIDITNSLQQWIRKTEIPLVTNWRKTERVYKDVQLEYFVADMARWYGFKFTSLDCLPKKKISTVICYRANIKDFIAVIRNSGVKVRETREGYAFCDPEPKAFGQMAIVEKGVTNRGKN